MPLSNIDYNIGQDNMQDVFDKTNIAIDKINAIDNWLKVEKADLFITLVDDTATHLFSIDNAYAYYNNKLVNIYIELVFESRLATGGGSDGVSFEFKPAFLSVENLPVLKEVTTNYEDILTGPTNPSSDIISYSISDTSPLGSFGNRRFYVYSENGGTGSQRGWRKVFNFTYRIS
jgi:hypothetical protein